MIGFLRGRLVDKHPPTLVMDVNGVGYEVEAPMSTFYQLPLDAAEIRLFTHLVVRDDAHILFGFWTRDEREMFRALIRINGVGAKMALAILSGMSAAEFASCVSNGDATALTRLPGIGKKTAERLIVEMRDRLPEAISEAAIGAGPAPGVAPMDVGDAVSDAVNALVALGYKPADASKMVRALDTEDMSVEDIIKSALSARVK
ncbi:MAG: Holliday junction branch migration protein RuvA [Gammaproteobacteria bacterium]